MFWTVSPDRYRGDFGIEGVQFRACFASDVSFRSFSFIQLSKVTIQSIHFKLQHTLQTKLSIDKNVRIDNPTKQYNFMFGKKRQFFILSLDKLQFSNSTAQMSFAVL